MVLYHVPTRRLLSSRDIWATWYFFQSSSPYSLHALAVPTLVFDFFTCEVYTLGGSRLLWSGFVGDIPFRLRSYLSEVRVFDLVERISNV